LKIIKGLEILNNTLASKGIYACGVCPEGQTFKQEKLWLQSFDEDYFESQASAFRQWFPIQIFVLT